MKQYVAKEPSGSVTDNTVTPDSRNSDMIAQDSAALRVRREKLCTSTVSKPGSGDLASARSA